ncbi:MAG: hypothetical protein WAV79_22340, partial [Anaerolineae bacterium]
MNCTNCGAKIPEGAQSCPACDAAAAEQPAPAQRPSIAVDQRVCTNAGQVVGVNAGKGGLRDGLDAAVTQEVGEVAPGGVVVGTISGVQGPVHVGGQQTYYQGDLAYDVRGLDNPYLGLRAYTYEERDRYAGREEDVRRALAALTRPGDERTLFFVTGASGSGKSSFAQAGLLPALEKHYQQQAFTVKWAVFRPGEKPLAALATELRTLGLAAEGIFAPAAAYQSALTQPAGPDQVSILIVDQFEELFTQAEAGQRDALFAILAALPPFRAGRLHVIATMRADYLPDLFEQRALYDIAKAGADLRAM